MDKTLLPYAIAYLEDEHGWDDDKPLPHNISRMIDQHRERSEQITELQQENASLLINIQIIMDNYSTK